LFLLGGGLLGPKLDSSHVQVSEAEFFACTLIVSLLDSVLLLAIVRTSRLHGLTLMLTLGATFYFVKTLTSSIEAYYFMPNVTGGMVPNLLLMTVPLTLGIAPLATWLGGRARPGPLDEQPGFRSWAMSRVELAIKVLFLSVVLYPGLFYVAGRFIALRSAELRAFYGIDLGRVSFGLATYALECVRGGLWVGAAALIVRSTRGPWWLGALWTGLVFSLLQNGLHLMPNPLMSAEIRLYHFVETATSNLLFGVCCGWLLSTTHARMQAQQVNLA
jgi:hypothetical protein